MKTLSDCLTLLTNMYPMVMEQNDNCLQTGSQQANDFKSHFSTNFNNQHYHAVIYESDDSIKLDYIFQKLHPSMICEMISETKESATITFSFSLLQ